MNLTGNHLPDFKRRFVAQTEKNETYADLLEWFLRNNDVDDTIRDEKGENADRSRHGFLAENGEDADVSGIIEESTLDTQENF